MRIIQVKLYQYDELSPDAQQKARDWFRNCDSYPWWAENSDSLSAFCEAFPVRAKDWEYGGTADITPCFTGDDEVGDLRGSRLAGYLWSNYADILAPFKRYGRRTSHIVRETGGACPFTGYHMDEALLDPLREFMANPRKRPGVTFADLLSECLWAWANHCRADMEDYYSDEQVAESIRANEYEFTEDGGLA